MVDRLNFWISIFHDRVFILILAVKHLIELRWTPEWFIFAEGLIACNSLWRDIEWWSVMRRVFLIFNPADLRIPGCCRRHLDFCLHSLFIHGRQFLGQCVQVSLRWHLLLRCQVCVNYMCRNSILLRQLGTFLIDLLGQLTDWSTGRWIFLIIHLILMFEPKFELFLITSRYLCF